MANKNVFTYGRNGKRKIGHSKFDMGKEHLMSANFGGLHLAALYETLPDDYWHISDNTVTLLKPLTAPAFTRINQNFYGAYVRNQQIWKHWNDYISNGTAYGDVYGNNVTNQSLENAWEIPNIPTPYAQVICKLGSGYATPFFVTFFDSSHPLHYVLKDFTFHNIGDIPESSVIEITDAFYAGLQRTDLADIPSLQPYIDFGLSKLSFRVFTTKQMSIFRIEFFCGWGQYFRFCQIFTDLTITSESSSYIGSGSLDHSSFLPYENHFYAFFCDDFTADPTTATSPFLIEKSLFVDRKSQSTKTFDYFPRVVDSEVYVVSKHYRTGNNPYYMATVYQCNVNFAHGFRYVHANNIGGLSELRSGLSDTDGSSPLSLYWSVPTSIFGYPAVNGAYIDIKPLLESWVGSVHYYGVSSPKDLVFDSFGGSTSFTQEYEVDTLERYMSGFGSNYSIGFSPAISASLANVLCLGSSVDNLGAKALGFDDISFLIYLCKNSLTLMDEMNIRVDPLAGRPFFHYRFERINALPAFAYDKIWSDNFRNCVVSSPGLDWSCSNGSIFADASFYSAFVFNSRFKRPYILPSYYKDKTASDMTPNGWVLEIVTLPRNSQGSAYHTHLPVRGFSDVITLLTGYDFYNLFKNLNTTQLNIQDYYLPSYYNGLLHLKFQNFNKDYFTSALLDPMSGANQVAVGSTINELRQHEAEQHWWERTAMYRSIKNWFQGTYGITPVELPEDSRITGTDHIDISIGEVIQTSGSTPESPQGSRTGLGGARGSGILCHGHANEHGWIFVLVSHTIESQYLQVHEKMFDVKDSFLDYPTIDFAGIGNESILQKEVNYTTVPTSSLSYAPVSQRGVLPLPAREDSSLSYRGESNPARVVWSNFNSKSMYFNIAKNAGTSLDNVFGFTPRYSSYKFKFDQVSGQFRHELKFWHTFKRYLTQPILCHEFVNWELAADDEEINRIFAFSDDFADDKFTIDCFINATVDRALPFVCVPSSK